MIIGFPTEILFRHFHNIGQYLYVLGQLSHYSNDPLIVTRLKQLSF
jgi:hypothetical protein